MRTLINIAKSELNTLFYSPIAWLILVVFVFQTDMAFTTALQDLVRDKSLGWDLERVTDTLFNGWRGVYSVLKGDLYLYIPLLTMGVMSRELQSGSIKLLYSSPVTDRKIIYGKYLGLVMYCFILLSIMLVLGIYCLIFVEAVEFSVILSGFLALFLLICTYAAIGLFISSMTQYQVAAAIGTLAILAVLNLIGGVGQDVEWMRNITYWLSMSGRTDDMIHGLIGTDDVAYFIIVIGLFLSLSILRLRFRRARKKTVYRVVHYGVVVAVFLGLGYLTALPGLMAFHDCTATNKLSLTEQSQKVMKQLPGPMTVNTYVNLLDKHYYCAMPKQVNNDMRLFKQYRRFKPEIKMKYFYYYDSAPNPELDKRFEKTPDIRDRAAIIAQGHRVKLSMFKTPEEMRDIIDLGAEEHRFVRQITAANGKSVFLRIYDDMSRHPSEREITAAMKRLTCDVPVVGFLTGHGERSSFKYGDRDYFTFASSLGFRYSLKNQGFETKEVRLLEGQPIPEDVSVLVIADIREPLKAWEQRQLDDYVAKGGNLMIAGDVGRQKVMNPIVEKIGVKFMDGTVVQTGTKHNPDVIQGTFSEAACNMSGTYRYLRGNGYKVMIDGGPALDISGCEAAGFQCVPLVVPDSLGCWTEKETSDFADEIPVFNPAAGEKMVNNACLAAALSKKLEDGTVQFVIVLSDADCISNGEFSRNRGVATANYNIVLESFSWFTGGEFPVNVSRPPTKDNDVRIATMGVKVTKVALLGLLPAFLALWGLFVWIKRRKY